jgi:hypothetical protein
MTTVKQVIENVKASDILNKKNILKPLVKYEKFFPDSDYLGIFNNLEAFYDAMTNENMLVSGILKYWQSLGHTIQFADEKPDDMTHYNKLLEKIKGLDKAEKAKLKKAAKSDTQSEDDKSEIDLDEIEAEILKMPQNKPVPRATKTDDTDKEQQISELKEKITTLKEKNDSLKSRNEWLQAEVMRLTRIEGEANVLKQLFLNRH